jgi:hypothetical protein
MDVGLGLNKKQICSVLGNMHFESKLSSDNASDSYGNRIYAGVHNPNYTNVYSASDGCAYGLIQWYYSSRKQGLLNTANTMGLAVSDINAQLAWLRSEIGSKSGSWKQKSNVNDITTQFASDVIENSGSKEARKKYANAIYSAFSNF